MPDETLETPQPTQTTESKQTNWPKMVLTAVLGFGLLAGAAYAGYWYGTETAKLKTQIPETPTPTPTPLVEDKTKDWRTYTNTKYGYKISYPGQLTVKEQTSDIFLHQVSFESSLASYLAGFIFIIEVKEGGNIANEVEYRKWQIVGHVADKVENESAIDVAGYQGVRLDYEVTGSVPEDKKEFGTVIFTNGRYTYTIKANATLLPQILSTFKFLD